MTRHEENALQANEEQARVLSEVIDVIAGALDTDDSALPSIHSAVLGGLQRAFGIERGAILFFDADGVMRFKAWRGLSETYRNAVEGHTVWPLGTTDPKSVVIRDVLEDATQTQYHAIFAGENIRALAFIPLIYRRNVIGKLMLYSRVPYDFKRELEFSLTLGKLVAFAITRHKIVEQLRTSEELFRATFEHSSLGKVLLSAPDGRFLRVNAQFATMLGYSAEELIGMNFADITHPMDVNQGLRAFHQSLDGEHTHDVDKRFIRKDRQILWVSTHSGPIRDSSGQTSYVVTAIQDITARKKMETQLRDGEARKSAILESALDCIVTIDHRARIIEFNHAAETEFGYARNEVLGKEIADVLLPPSHREAHRKGFINYLRTGCGPILGRRIETTAMRADGTFMPVELSVTTVSTEGPPIFTGFIRNISERKKAREEVRRAKEDLEIRVQERTADLSKTNAFLSSLIENIPNMIFVKEAKELRFVRFNKAGEELIGYSREALIGKNDYDFFPEDEATFFTTMDRNVLAQHAVVDIPEEPIRTRTRGERILHTTKIPIYDLEGRPEYLLGISEDITEKKRSEEDRLKLMQEREARAEAEKGIRLRDDFLAIAAHELRTPLTPIRMYFQLVNQHIDRFANEIPNVELLRKAIRRTDEEFDRFLRLVENLLDVSRITAGGLLLEPRECDLAEIARNVAERFAAMLRKAQCELRVDIPYSVVGFWDPIRMDQVVTNLLTNATKYGAQKPIDLKVWQTEHAAFLSVQDHGIGITLEDQQRIFQRFERVAPLKHFAGFGLGLFISREIVAKHNGTIWLVSEPNVGSTFTVELPFSQAALPIHEPRA